MIQDIAHLGLVDDEAIALDTSFIIVLVATYLLLQLNRLIFFS